MEKGISKHWTPGKDLEFEERLKRCRSFAQRHLIMLLRDLLKYDGRSKESERAMAQARLRLAVANDEDLKELAELMVEEGERSGEISGLHRASLRAERLGQLKNTRAEIREEGIKREELQCR